LERKEWEDKIASKWPVLDAAKTGKLRPVFTVTVTRTVITIKPVPSAQIEAAID
jgi:inorganic triphosphatase YgiF